MLENCNINLKDYQINSKQTFLIKKKLESLVRQCPSNALISLQGHYTDKQFEGHLSVTSTRKAFYAEAKEETFELFLKSLCKKMQKQVYRWKKNRTYEEITGIINLDNYRSLSQKKEPEVFPDEKIAV